MLPVYQSTDTYRQAKAIFGDQSHSGLWFERFYDYQIFDSYGNEVPNKDDAKKSQKEDFFKSFNGSRGIRECGNGKNLQDFAKRQVNLCHAQGGKATIYQNDWLMAIGLGNSHPLENGLLWHPTLGVPYFQGSTVKGLAKALMEKWGADPQLIKRWFGSVNATTSKTANFAKMFGMPLTEELTKQLDEQSIGAFIFLDAVPVQPVMLNQAIMTPHYGDWYQKGDTNPLDKNVQPGDWHSPVPVNFLAVEKAVMQFAVLPRLGSNVSDEELEQISNVITMALEHLGIGGKTATGYGRMRIDEKSVQEQKAFIENIKEQAKQEDDARKKQAELDDLTKNATALEAELIRDIAKNQWATANDTVKQSFTQSIPAWLEKLQSNPTEQNAIERFIEIASIHYASQIKKPEKAKDNQKKWILPLLALQKS